MNTKHTTPSNEAMLEREKNGALAAQWRNEATARAKENMREYQPKTGERCSCKPGIYRDNCPDCEGTGWRIDFRKIREG
jgi:hypothetical protein